MTGLCTQCGAALGEHEAFCTRCGARRNQTPGVETRSCANCGNELKPNVRFCEALRNRVVPAATPGSATADSGTFTQGGSSPSRHRLSAGSSPQCGKRWRSCGWGVIYGCRPCDGFGSRAASQKNKHTREGPDFRHGLGFF